MSRIRLVAAATLVALVATVLTSSPHQTRANWRETSTLSLGDTQSDRFTMTVTDVPGAIDHSQSTPTTVLNQPSVALTNQSRTHRSLVSAPTATQSVPASNTSSTLAGQLTVTRALRSPDCGSGAATDIAPQGSARLCYSATPVTGTLDTATGRSTFLRSYAGRQLDLGSTVSQKSYDPGTWSSATSSVTSRLQVKLPPPTRPSSDNVVCARTFSGGDRSSVGLFGRLYWAWPFAGDSASASTPAVNRFTLIRSTDGVSWSTFKQSSDQSGTTLYSTAGNTRESQNINSNDLANNAATPVYLSVRAYLYAGTSVYVDADWMVLASEGDSQLADYFTCRSGAGVTATAPGVTNPNWSPVGLG